MLKKDIINNSEGNFKSLQEELRFKIGEQYELNEFHLKTLKSTFINGIEYENYEYIKDDFKTLFDFKVINIILQYNGEILSGIIYKFEIRELDNLIKRISSYCNFSKNKEIDNIVLGQTFTISNFYKISLMLDAQRNVQLRVFKSLG